MRGDINFKGSDSSDLSVYFLFCGNSGDEITGYDGDDEYEVEIVVGMMVTMMLVMMMMVVIIMC